MFRYIFYYTARDSRDCVYEGTFEKVTSGEFRVGDYFLTHHRCLYTGERILEKVIVKKLSHHFQGEPVYDLIVTGGSSYKSVFKLVSMFDRLVRTVPMEEIAERHLNFKYD